MAAGYVSENAQYVCALISLRIKSRGKSYNEQSKNWSTQTARTARSALARFRIQDSSIECEDLLACWTVSISKRCQKLYLFIYWKKHLKVGHWIW